MTLRDDAAALADIQKRENECSVSIDLMGVKVITTAGRLTIDVAGIFVKSNDAPGSPLYVLPVASGE